MKRKIYLEVEFDWEDYDDVSDELILEDSGILDAIKDGVQVKLFAIPDVNHRRKLLIDFIHWYDKEHDRNDVLNRPDVVNAFLKSINCG